MGNVETLLALLYADGNGGGGGGGGTTNYNALTNRPKINGHVLEGDKTSEDLGIKGQAPDITVNASVDNTTGTPSVEVTKSGTDEAPIFEMAFTGLKGQTGQQGAPGAPGAPGPTGEDGFSPEITVEEITGGHRITITTKTGTESFDVMDGQGGGSGDDVFVATYGVTTAQQINAFLDSNDPKAPMVVKRGNDYYTVITTVKQAENKVIIRTFASLSGAFYIFTYTVTDNTWSNSNYGVQQLLVSGVNIKTVGGQSLLGEGDIPIQGGGGNASFDVATIPQGPTGNNEVNAVTSNGDSENEIVSYIRAEDGTLPDEITLVVNSALGEDRFQIPTKEYVDSQTIPSYVVDKPEGATTVSGNVVQVGSFTDTDGTKYGIFEFYYKTSALPAADTTKTYSFSPLLDNYTIFEFIDQSGITNNGHVISSGRTDGTSRIIIQQFSKNNKNVMLRAYGDYSSYTALLRIKFIGTKNA